MLHLKLVEESPSISEVWLNLNCPEEPLSGFGDLTLTPKQPAMCTQTFYKRKIKKKSSKKTECEMKWETRTNCSANHETLSRIQWENMAILGNSEQDMGIMFTLLQSINAFSLPLGPGLQKHSLSPQDTFVGRDREWCKRENMRLQTLIKSTESNKQKIHFLHITKVCNLNKGVLRKSADVLPAEPKQKGWYSHLNWGTPAGLWPWVCWRCSSARPWIPAWLTPTWLILSHTHYFRCSVFVCLSVIVCFWVEHLLFLIWYLSWKEKNNLCVGMCSQCASIFSYMQSSEMFLKEPKAWQRRRRWKPLECQSKYL